MFWSNVATFPLSRASDFSCTHEDRKRGVRGKEGLGVRGKSKG